MARRSFAEIKIDDVYDKWTVVGGPTGGSAAHCKWECRCVCGDCYWVNANSLVRGLSTQCLSCAGRNPTFAHVPKELFWRIRSIAKSATRRCTNSADEAYHNYGGRGIKVCFTTWQSFVTHLLTLPGHDDPDLMLDRENNEGHYEEGNLRFVTPFVSTQNRRVIGEVTYFIENGFAWSIRKLYLRGVTITNIAKMYCTQRHIVRRCL